MKVHVNGYGLRPFQIEETFQLDSTHPKQYKGKYELPDRVTTADGKKWIELDYWFTKEEIYKTE